MKYRVGDKVLFEGDLDFLFNDFHKERYRKGLIRTVTEANDKLFSIYKPEGRYKTAIEQGLAAGINRYMLFRQEDGRTLNWPGRERLLHLEKDHDYIVKKIKDIGFKDFIKSEQMYLSQINTAKNMLRIKKEEYNADLEKNLQIINVALRR